MMHEGSAVFDEATLQARADDVTLNNFVTRANCVDLRL